VSNVRLCDVHLCLTFACVTFIGVLCTDVSIPRTTIRVGGASALVTFICVLYTSAHANFTTNMQLHTLRQ
jgi:hypothetical protein